MDDQMEMVFKSSRDESDPVSGNEVPTGAMPEEVRDDIPAQLSEGEYVVPADVLRYYGVKFFEDLRSQAKQGWQELDEGGRVGGEPMGMEMGDDELPFDISELQVIEDGEMGEQPEMNQGGYIDGYADGGMVQPGGSSIIPSFTTGSPTASTQSSAVGGIELREYVGPDGAIMYVQFLNGSPLSIIPEGYKPKGTVAEEVATSVAEKSDSGSSRDSDRDMPDAGPKKEDINWATADANAFNDYLESRDSKLGQAIKTGVGLMGGPVARLALKGVEKLQYNNIMNGLNTQLEDPEISKEKREELLNIKSRMEEEPDKSIAGKVKDTLIEKSGVYGGESSMYKNLKDTNADKKVSFADTWLGDTLGFDGKAGTQGASLSESLGGARRDNKSDKDSSSASSTPSSSSQGGGSNTLTQSLANIFTPNDKKSYVGGKLVEDKD